MSLSRKYGRTFHYPFSPGTTSDDRINHDYWNDVKSISQVVHTEKLDGENTCLNQYGVFARSHAVRTFLLKKNYRDVPIISLDDIRRTLKISPTDKKRNGRVVQMAKEQARVHLRKKETFIWNATNISKNIRKTLIEMFQDYGAKTKLIYLEVPYQKLLKQNSDREYPIPQKVLEKMISGLQVPADWEAPVVELFTR